jgi:hypothetical protein
MGKTLGGLDALGPALRGRQQPHPLGPLASPRFTDTPDRGSPMTTTRERADESDLLNEIYEGWNRCGSSRRGAGTLCDAEAWPFGS